MTDGITANDYRKAWSLLKNLHIFTLFDKQGFLQGHYAGVGKTLVEKAIKKEFSVDNLNGFRLKKCSKRAITDPFDVQIVDNNGEFT